MDIVYSTGGIAIANSLRGMSPTPALADGTGCPRKLG
jgi:hypothetical protein